MWRCFHGDKNRKCIPEWMKLIAKEYASIEFTQMESSDVYLKMVYRQSRSIYKSIIVERGKAWPGRHISEELQN